MKKTFTNKLPSKFFLAILIIFSLFFAGRAQADIGLTADATSTSATIRVTGLVPNNNDGYQVNVQGIDDTAYNKTQNITSNSEGAAQSVFSGLKSNSTKGYQYKASLIIKQTGALLKQINFTTKLTTSGGSIDGSCGSSNGATLESKPSTNLCKTGTATAVSGSGPWTWVCKGQNGGKDISCKANLKTVEPPSGGSENLAAGWYYEMNDASGTRLVGPNTAEECQNDLDDQVAKGALITKSCYEVKSQGGDGSESDWYYQWKGNDNAIITTGPNTESECKTDSQAQSNSYTIVKSCYKMASSSSQSPSSSNNGDLSYKGGGLVPDCPADGCGWNELMQLIATVIDFLIFYLSLPIAAIAFAYSGWLFMTSGDNPGNRTKAIDIFKKVGLGLVIAMAAWLIVSTILTTLVKTELIDDYSLLEGIK